MKYPFWAERIYHGLWGVVDVLYPPNCGGCGAPATRWCADCQSAVRLVSLPVCKKCGLPQEHPGLCSRCREMLPRFNRLRSWSVFESPIQDALHRLKYRRDLGLGEAIAGQMADFIERLGWQEDMIAPMPLGKRRMKQRGYNQVTMLAFPLALRLGYPYRPGVLVRIRDTHSQVGLSASERQRNMMGAFRASTSVSGKRVLLIDDIATTGATASSAAEALYQAGARTVDVVTVARALPIHGLMHV